MTNIPEARIEELIRQCQQEGENSIQEGNPPFGCVITDPNGGLIILKTPTTIPQLTPRYSLLRGLGQKLRSRYLDGCVMFANAKSCSMCMTASIKAHVQTFYFGAASEAKMNPWLTVQDAAAKATTPLEIRSSILGGECAEQIERSRRQEA